MITIAMNPTGALDRNTISSINHTDAKNTLTAQDIISSQNRQGTSPLGTQGASTCSRQDTPVSNRPGTSANKPGTPTSSKPGIPASNRLGTSANKPGTPTSSKPGIPASNRPGIPASNKQGMSASNRQGTPVPHPVASHPVPSPAQKRLPAFAKPIQKGQKVPLESNMPLGSIRACFGWNTADPRCDVDVSAFLLSTGGKVPGDSWFVFYGQTESPDKSCRFQAQASHANAREAISIDFTKLNRNVEKIVFVLTIHDAIAQKLHFGMLKDAYIQILDAGNSELASFRLTDYYPDIISMMIGELYNYKGKWKFNAIGNGVARDLAGLCVLYGVQVSS